MMLNVEIAAVYVSGNFVMTAALAPDARMKIAEACNDIMMASRARMGMVRAAAQNGVQKHRRPCHRRYQASKHSSELP